MRHAGSDCPNQTILVVEDAEAIRRMVSSMLRQSGYNCIEAANGMEALRLLEDSRETVNLMITDLMMPHINGDELARRVARLRPAIRVLFMSGYSDEPLVRAVEHSQSLFLAKPFTATALMEKVEQVLGRPWPDSSGAHFGSGAQ